MNGQGKPGGRWIQLWRAVKAEELDSIRRLDAFTNIPGIERKYFTATLAGARAYAQLASLSYGDGPYFLVATWGDASLLPPDCWATVDRGIEIVAVPTELLYLLAPPTIVEE